MRPSLVLVGGVPGAGKSYVSRHLAKRLGVGVLVDKDVVSGPFVEKMLALLGSHADDRESEVYLTRVRDLEYQVMMDQALENLELGHNVICSAPFLREFADDSWLEALREQASQRGAELTTVWVHADPQSTRLRIASRGANRDLWKLANWDKYIAGLPEGPPPQASARIIDNSRRPRTPIGEQIDIVISAILKGRPASSQSPRRTAPKNHMEGPTCNTR